MLQDNLTRLDVFSDAVKFDVDVACASVGHLILCQRLGCIVILIDKDRGNDGRREFEFVDKTLYVKAVERANTKRHILGFCS